jgi:hypothetical protein
MASSVRIAVVRFKDEYRIVAPTGSWGRFRFRVDAEEAALRLASRQPEQSPACEILVQEPFGELTALKS